MKYLAQLILILVFLGIGYYAIQSIGKMERQFQESFKKFETLEREIP